MYVCSLCSRANELLMHGFNWEGEQLLPSKNMTELRQTKRAGLELDDVGKAS